MMGQCNALSQVLLMILAETIFWPVLHIWTAAGSGSDVDAARNENHTGGDHVLVINS